MPLLHWKTFDCPPTDRGKPGQVVEEFWRKTASCRYWGLNDSFATLRLAILFSGPDNPENCPFPWGISTTSSTWFLGPHTPQSQPCHLNQFSCFRTVHQNRQNLDRFLFCRHLFTQKRQWRTEGKSLRPNPEWTTTFEVNKREGVTCPFRKSLYKTSECINGHTCRHKDGEHKSTEAEQA